MADEYLVIRVDDAQNLQGELQTAADDRYEWVGTMSAKNGDPVVVMKRTKRQYRA